MELDQLDSIEQSEEFLNYKQKSETLKIGMINGSDGELDPFEAPEASPHDIDIDFSQNDMFTNNLQARGLPANDSGSQLIQDDAAMPGNESAFGYQPPAPVQQQPLLQDSNREVKINFGQGTDSKIGKSQDLGAKSQMRKSLSGFDIGASKAMGSFFSNVRQKAEGEQVNFYNSEESTGKQFIQMLTKQQEERYHKKFAFERGQYHQCFPNPRVPDQMITVQLVNRVTEGLGKRDTATAGAGQYFGAKQADSVSKEIKTVSQQFQRYKLVPPEASDDEDGRGEGEGEGYEDPERFQIKQEHSNAMAVVRQSTSAYGGFIEQLYKESALVEEVDQLSGVEARHYANAVKSGQSQQLAMRSYMDCLDFAVVAFWDLNQVSDQFQCSRFFVVPNPVKRNIGNKEGTLLDQVLYTSTHTNEVFFFFKGFEKGAGDDLDTVTAQEYKLQLAFLQLEVSVEERQRIGDRRNIYLHCDRLFVVAEGSILYEYVTYLHETEIADQKQLPNPTVIDCPENSGSTLVVFTAYMSESLSSKQQLDGGENDISGQWYPTIFFYDISKNHTVWEIFGAELFIDIDPKQKVSVLTNEIWTELTQEQYESAVEQDPEDFSRHWDNDNLMWRIRYGTQPTEQELGNKDSIAPSVPTLNCFKLTFGNNKNLEITDEVKVIEAHLHNHDRRFTLIYKGLGSFTFQLKKAKSLVDPSDWYGEYEGRSFHANLAFKANLSQRTDRIVVQGSGKDEDDKPVDVHISLDYRDVNTWEGYFETATEMRQIFIPQVLFDENSLTLRELPDGDDFYGLQGELGYKNRQTQTRPVTMYMNSQEEDNGYGQMILKGQVDPFRSNIKGQWSYEHMPEQKFFFELHIANAVTGTLNLKFLNEDPVEKRIKVDFEKREIQAADGEERNVEFYAIEAVDQAELCYFILQSDVVFVRNTYAQPEETYVQAKLTSIAEEDINSNGAGVAQSSVVLYQVSESLKEAGVKQGKKKVVQEPRARHFVKFFLNQSYLRTYEKKESQLWHVNGSFINAQGRFFGSVIYEEYGTDEMILNFVTASLDDKDIVDDSVEDFDYPQQPVPQTWIVDYPLLAYKTFTPNNKEIAVVHMALNMPQRIIHLGDWEFLCFVNHTQMVEQKLFDKAKETNCDIMFLARRGRKIRLMSFKSNPWLQFAEEVDETRMDKDIYKQAIFLFSGSVQFMPTEDSQGEAIPNNKASMRKFCRRFSSDKIQNAQLITKTLGSYEQFMLLLQFNDCIVQASLNNKLFKVICEPQAMLRRHLVRGYNEKIFFAESSGNAEKIYQVEFHNSKPDELTKKEIYQLAGSWLVAFEADAENKQNDMEEGCVQSLFIMDDQQKIYLLKNEDDVRFVTKKVIDFASHNKLAEVNALRDNDWAHVHLTERTLSFNGFTYNLNSELATPISIPNLYFGQEKRTNSLGRSMMSASQNLSIEGESEDSEGDFADEDNDHEILVGEAIRDDEWVVQDVQSMAMTTNLIAQCQRNHKEFCFVVKPAPGSRKLNIVGYQQLAEIEQMLFVSNNHVLMKFRGGKAVTLLSNGCIVHQATRVQSFLEEHSKVIGESQIFRGKKTVLLEQEYGENQEKTRYVALKFNALGLAQVVGIFDMLKAQVAKVIDNFWHAQTRFAEDFDELSKSNTRLSKMVSNTFADIMNDAKSVILTTVKKHDNKPKIKIKYAKEFFVTERGEIIRMAAIVTSNPFVIDELKQDVRIFENDKKNKSGKKTSFKTGHKVSTFISVFEVINSHSPADYTSEDADMNSSFKLIVFHCLNEEHQRQLTKDTQYCVVGNFLCHRNRGRQTVWVTKLKSEAEELIPVNRFDGEKFSNPEEFESKKRDQFKTYESVAISIGQMVNNSDLEHIQMTEVPKAYFTTIKSRNGFQVEFYNNLLQITVRAHGMIFDLDSSPIREVDSIESIDQFQDPDCFVNTGFIMSTSKNDYWEDQKYLKRQQVFTNEYASLFFGKLQERYEDGTREFDIAGMLFRTFSEIDLGELQMINQSAEARSKIQDIDHEALLCSYEGHTVFSIFADNISVYEKILAQLQDLEVQPELDFNGLDCENGMLRRLYRILNFPTADLKHSRAKENASEGDIKTVTEMRRMEQNLLEEQQSFWGQLLSSVKKKLGLVSDTYNFGANGFKSVQKKSLHFQSARFRESLMEIAMLCQETSISNFVDNQLDIQILFISMSPATLAFFENGFNRTRFTEQIKNLDWKLGSTLKVLGQMTSVITEKQANWKITDGKPGSQSEDVQNRQVDAKMLQIDWVFSSYGGIENVGFRELVIALANAPHESLFSTELVITLVEHFWSRYYYAIFVRCFMPFCLYFCVTVFYMSKYAVEGIPVEERWSLTTELVMRFIIIVCVLYFFFFEVVSVLRDGHNYLRDVFNYVDLSAFALNFYLIYTTVNQNATEGNRETVRNLASLTCVLMWFKAFYWMRLFTNTSFYVRLIRETIFDIRYFLILFVVILMTFGNTLLILSENRSNPLYQNFFGVGFLDVVMNQYMLALGEFDTENYEMAAGDIIVWVIFIATTFITQITFLNMLIAIMGDTFARVSEVKEQSALAEKIQILADYVIVVRRESVERGNLSRFVFALGPKALGQDEIGSWEGTVTQLKKSMDVSINSVKAVLNKRIRSVSAEVALVNAKLGFLDDKVNELHGSQQRLPAAMEHVMRRVLREHTRGGGGEGLETVGSQPIEEEPMPTGQSAELLDDEPKGMTTIRATAVNKRGNLQGRDY